MQRQLSVLPCCTPTPTPSGPCAVQQAKIGADEDIPHLSREFIGKYVTDLELLDVLTR